MLTSGQVLNDRYRVILWLADGGQSTVYMATDEKTFGRQVVVKAKYGLSVLVDEKQVLAAILLECHSQEVPS